VGGGRVQTLDRGQGRVVFVMDENAKVELDPSPVQDGQPTSAVVMTAKPKTTFIALEKL
jgi:hypothetical protein